MNLKFDEIIMFIQMKEVYGCFLKSKNVVLLDKLSQRNFFKFYFAVVFLIYLYFSFSKK